MHSCTVANKGNVPRRRYSPLTSVVVSSWRACRLAPCVVRIATTIPEASVWDSTKELQMSEA